MDVLFSSLFVMRPGSQPELDFDILGQLPNEIGSMILRYLDGKSLLKAATVSKRWNSLCRGDKKLRQRGRQQLRMMKKRKKEQIYGTLKRSSYVPVDEVPAFRPKTSRNVVRSIQKDLKPIEAPAIPRTNENILEELKINLESSVKIQRLKKSLSSQQKRRLLRH
ncbi:uncharacterized protein LOC111048891 [Nilaparvata lugens]|uniref:uncharacterized protein LOC111048891 n=1 Tax=Nilaparvata lugens TaxID=108931 RepID=UPI00193D58B1|nr:uncharacterized protein LOC111048891 [Nilaparvata lugens]